MPRAIRPSVNAWSPEYLEAEYARFKADPSSVPEDLRAFFLGFDLAGARPALEGGGGGGADEARFDVAVEALIAAYRTHGHRCAKIDSFHPDRARPGSLSLAAHGLTEADLGRSVRTATIAGPAGRGTLRELVEHLERTYCGPIAFEVMHVQDDGQRQWLLERIERDAGVAALPRGRRVHILEQLLKSEEFEKFLGNRYPGDKRFSLEGSESTIPWLDHLMEAATELGVEEVVLGMAHRGRLNVLNNILGKTYEQIFTEFEDNLDEPGDGGDVKYHRGYSGQRTFPNGKTLHLAMASNPSHLESVNAVVEGRCRAKQRLRGDMERTRVIPVLIHGDGAIAGQGVIAEVLNMAYLPGYTTGGTVHLVINNLVAFTTSPEDGRSTEYCTDIAKAIDAPVFHVNGDDPEAVVATAQIAIEFRQRFKRDVFVDLYCYRKYGHNEQDEATFTQPLLYAQINKRQSVLKVYAERLLAEGVITETDMGAIRKRLDDALNQAQEAAKRTPHDPTIDPGSKRWQGMGGEYTHAPAATAVSGEMIAEVCAAMGRVPAGFNLNPKLKKLLESRAALPQTRAISYADAESLAYGTLLLEGTAVRLSGQDCRRGTFSHRHAVLRDTETGEAYMPLNAMREVGQPGTPTPPRSVQADGRTRQARLCVYDSPLSEYSVLGFDYGYSLADPDMLVLWEAQFGDFNNGAQIMIDQYIASGEIKWDRWSGLVMLLPHGYEGAGPEHSSARLERFLLLCANDNMQVVNPTTAAQTFHVLRRQVKRNFRKPLIVMTPKSLLRTNTSDIGELTTGRFHEVLDDPAFDSGTPWLVEPRPAAWDRSGVKRVILCSGKLFYELSDRRMKLGRKDVAIVRVEQLYPLHGSLLASILARYPKGAEVCWVQEEPRNAGAFLYMDDALRHCAEPGLRGDARLKSLVYIGRDACATPAAASKHVHKEQQEAVISRAIGPMAKGH
ncbi:MAG: 2-oxoglutarate dehydrogenase E1 component [Phycisphaerae bacterium]|nr:2-oxoglutarate dehydrogenase E1 component [Phycisphaerae bacterium]